MEDEWITEDAALAWLQETYKLPPAVAENQLIDAFRSGNVPARDTITRLIEDPPGNFRAELIPRHVGVLGSCHEQRYRVEELRWQIDRQLAPVAPGGGKGFRTTTEKTAEERCQEMLAAMPAEPRRIKADLLDEAKAKWPRLTKTAFERAWASIRGDKGWDAPGRPRDK